MLGEAVLPSTPLRFEGIVPPPLRMSRALGADNEAVYGELLGLSPQRSRAVARRRRDLINMSGVHSPHEQRFV